MKGELIVRKTLKKAILRKVGNYKQNDKKIWYLWSRSYPDTKRHIIEEFTKLLNNERKNNSHTSKRA